MKPLLTWNSFSMKRVLKFLNNKDLHSITQGYNSHILRKRGKSVILYTPKNRRYPPKLFNIEELKEELALAILLDSFE